MCSVCVLVHTFASLYVRAMAHCHCDRAQRVLVLLELCSHLRFEKQLGCEPSSENHYRWHHPSGLQCEYGAIARLYGMFADILKMTRMSCNWSMDICRGSNNKIDRGPRQRLLDVKANELRNIGQHLLEAITDSHVNVCAYTAACSFLKQVGIQTNNVIGSWAVSLHQRSHVIPP